MKAADCISYGFLKTVKLKVSGFHRHKSVGGGAYQKIEAAIASDIQLFYKLFFLYASLIYFFLMPGFCMNIDDCLTVLSLSRQF